MPTAARRTCTQPGCPKLVTSGRCLAHRKQQQRDADTKTPEERRFYSSRRWKRKRSHHLNREPLCRECRAEGRTRLGNVVDHIVPIRQGADPWDERNYQTLCWHHHQRKRAQERHG